MVVKSTFLAVLTHRAIRHIMWGFHVLSDAED